MLMLLFVCLFATNGKDSVITSVCHENDDISKESFLFFVQFELQIPQRADRLLDFRSVFAVKFRCFRDC
jgi:hypothetical protein